MSSAAIKSQEALTRRQGICTTCNLAAACTFPISADRPPLTCDEFEGLSSVMKAVPAVGLILVKQPVAAQPDASPTALAGLCRNCNQRNECTYPKTEGGILNCEEYI